MNIFKIAALLIIVFLCSYALLLYARPSEEVTPAEQEEAAIPTAAPNAQTTLSISPEFLKLTNTSAQNIRIMVDTGENSISQAQIEISYDPKALTVTAVNNGSFFPGVQPVVNKIDQRRGRIEFAVSLPENQEGIKGTGQLAGISFVPGPEASLSGQTRFTFLPKSSVRGHSDTASLLMSTKGILIDLTSFAKPQ